MGIYIRSESSTQAQTKPHLSYPWNNKAHKRQNTARNYSSLLYQTLQPIIATLAS